MQRILIADALAADAPRGDITICGWVRTRRDLAGRSFIEINDGSSLSGMQCVVEHDSAAYAALGAANTGAALRVRGALVPSPGKGQRWEVQAGAVTIFGLADPQSYPLQKKRHSDEFLRTIAHLRARTNKYGAAFRLRSPGPCGTRIFSRAPLCLGAHARSYRGGLRGRGGDVQRDRPCRQ